MWPLLVLGAVGLVLLTSTADKRPSTEPGTSSEKLEALVESMLDAPLSERQDLARQLVDIGEPRLAQKLLDGRRQRATPPTGAREQAVERLMTEWRELGGDELACTALNSKIVMSVQAVFAIEKTGVYDLETAMAAQSIDPEAPASCEWISTPLPAPNSP